MEEALFTSSFNGDVPPDGTNIFLQSLWWEKRGDWKKAHDLVEQLNSVEAAWIHAYLHRVEGDEWNADYWYRRAGKQKSGKSIAEEWQYLVDYFLKKQG